MIYKTLCWSLLDKPLAEYPYSPAFQRRAEEIMCGDVYQISSETVCNWIFEVSKSNNEVVGDSVSLSWELEQWWC